MLKVLETFSFIERHIPRSAWNIHERSRDNLWRICWTKNQKDIANFQQPLQASSRKTIHLVPELNGYIISWSSIRRKLVENLATSMTYGFSRGKWRDFRHWLQCSRSI